MPGLFAGRRGRVRVFLIGVLLLMLLMAIMVPAMVFLTQREARWAEKQTQSTIAFHLAEVGIEKGYRSISLSTAVFYKLTDNGTPIDDFAYETTFSDIPGGEYVVSVTSGPEARQATIISVGKVTKGAKTYVRTIKSVFAQFSEEVAISANAGIEVGGGVNVHWGAVISQKSIVADGRLSPQFKSAASIDFDTDGAGGVNCGPTDTDAVEMCCQWWSQDEDVPEALISADLYADPARNDTCNQYDSDIAVNDPLGSCYYKGDQNWSTGFASPVGSSVTIYVEGNVTLSQRFNIAGDIIIRGDLNVPNGSWGDGDIDMIVPRIAWKQYCNNWAYYLSEFEPGAGTWPGLSSGRKSAYGMNYQPTPGGKTAVQGLLYIGGNLAGGGGGGNTRIYGNLYIKGAVVLDPSSAVDVYYNKAAAENIKSLRLNLKRIEWQSQVKEWPGS